MRYDFHFRPILCHALAGALALTLAACGSFGNSPADTPLDDATADGLHPEERGDSGQRSSDAIEYAHRVLARSLAKRQYALILEWLHHQGLQGRTHDELMALADHDDAASEYLRCETASEAPGGQQSRLELLSSCLVRGVETATAVDAGTRAIDTTSESLATTVSPGAASTESL
jgi:hypothetical protein